MAKWKGERTNQYAIYGAVDKFKKRCLIDDGSVFTDEVLWTADGIAELVTHFVNNTKYGERDTFIGKFEKQLGPASNQAKRLAAEIYWFMQLCPIRRDMKPESKRKNISLIWSWSEEDLPQDHQLLNDEILDGIGSGNPGYSNNFPEELMYAIRLLEALKRLDPTQRSNILSGSQEFTEWLDRLQDSDKRQFRLMILNLLWPDEFESVFSNSQRKNILVGFSRKTRKESSEMSSVEIDHELLALRGELQEQYNTDHLDFFQPPLLERWRKEPVKKSNNGVVEPHTSTYAPIKDVPLNQILYGPPGTGKTYATTNKALEILDPDFLQANSGSRDKIKDRYDELKSDGRIEFATFHQSFSYEDFVEGLKASANQEGGVSFSVEDGIFKRICESCRDGNQRVLIIDEINRGNIANIFGELITLLEPSKREDASETLIATLPYSKDPFSVPSNLYIIGTMNTADRSLVYIDTALRRRFRFVEMMPDTSLLADIEVGGIDIKRMVDAMNQRIELLYDREHTLGHSFFLPLINDGTIDRLASIFRFEILPLLEEYFFEDWSRIQQVLGDSQKSAKDTHFYIDKFGDTNISELLGESGNPGSNVTSDGTGGTQATPYERNEDALKNPAAYIGIYSSAPSKQDETDQSATDGNP